MARSRNIKPGFFTNDELVELPFEYRLLFAGLWTLADREGRLNDRPKKIKMEIFPADNVDCEAGIQALEGKGFLQRYTVEGAKYIQIVTWKKHQNPHHKEVASTIPAMPGDEPAIEVSQIVDDSSMDHASDVDESSKEYGCAVEEESTGDPSGMEIASCPTDSLQSDSLNPITDSLQNTSAEQQAAAPPEVPIDPVFISIPRNDGSEHPITESQIWEWSDLFPAVDVRQTLRSIRAWAISNPRKRKTKTGMLKFVNAWLAREQDKGGQNAKGRTIDFQSAADRRAGIAAETYNYDRAIDF